MRTDGQTDTTKLIAASFRRRLKIPRLAQHSHEILYIFLRTNSGLLPIQLFTAFVAELECVYCAVRAENLDIIRVYISF